MEIGLGDYVRTRQGRIGKVVKILKSEHLVTKKTLINYVLDLTSVQLKDGCVASFSVKEHSTNIIDLIKKGDIIEIGNEKYEVVYDESYEKLGILIPNKKQLAIRHCSLEYIFSKEGIEEFKKISILTHTKFKKNAYKVEE